MADDSRFTMGRLIARHRTAVGDVLTAVIDRRYKGRRNNRLIYRRGPSPWRRQNDYFRRRSFTSAPKPPRPDRASRETIWEGSGTEAVSEVRLAVKVPVPISLISKK